MIYGSHDPKSWRAMGGVVLTLQNPGTSGERIFIWKNPEGGGEIKIIPMGGECFVCCVRGRWCDILLGIQNTGCSKAEVFETKCVGTSPSPSPGGISGTVVTLNPNADEIV